MRKESFLGDPVDRGSIQIQQVLNAGAVSESEAFRCVKNGTPSVSP